VLPAYAELHCLSNFSFLRGASHPEELVARALEQGYAALAITDECSLAGVVRAHIALKTLRESEPAAESFKLLIGAEFVLADGLKIILLAQNRAGYGNLSALITLARRRAVKGSYLLTRGDLEGVAAGGGQGGVPDCLLLWCAGEVSSAADGQWLAERFAGRAWIAGELFCGPQDFAKVTALCRLSEETGLPIVAAGDVHMHVKSRRPLQDALTALRLKSTVFDAGHSLYANGERHLRSRLRLARLYPPEWLAETLRVAARCEFSLAELRYEYPDEVVPHGTTPAAFLRQETEAGLLRRYGQGGTPDKVRRQVEHELALIAELGFEAYFLTIYDLVNFARGQGILCQGRGSAANSAVCYALGITEVDPAASSLLFERFISKERGEPPDIDVDFEHERREEVIQYLYAKYGRERAALTAAVITYHTRGALRDAGRALGFERSVIDALGASLAWWDRRDKLPERLQQVGLRPGSPRVAKWLWLTEQLVGFPRHLSQHSGGFVIARGALSRLVPIENAAMPERSVIQWDKDDLDALGLLKVDVLALGMLSALRRALDLVGERLGRPFRMQDIPREDAGVYEMLCRADSMGVFQVESRAQMAMLPRLAPRNFYDLVVEVALVRPGPIQGDMVHPYLRRRAGKEPVDDMKDEVKAVLGRTYGVPIFQEQVMALAVAAAGFTPGEADQLRRSMAAWRRRGGLEHFERKLIDGMGARGYSEEFARRIFAQIQGFGEYGFPESHAASFALLVYVSAWLKRYEPAAFLCALLNSQPMGFYSPSQLVQDARRHGVEVRPVDVTTSAWEATIERFPLDGTMHEAVRLGLRTISGLAKATGERIAAARQARPFASLADLAVRADLARADLDRLAAADALTGLAGHRRQAAWAASEIVVQHDLFSQAEREPSTPASAGNVTPDVGAGGGLMVESGSDVSLDEGALQLPAPSEGENLVADYGSLGMTLRRHPLSLLRTRLQKNHFLAAAELAEAADRQLARAAGLVVGRQRPGTATGIVFVTLEDETGNVNVVVYPQLVDQQRRELLGARLLGVYGQVQREGRVVHLVAKRFVDLSSWLGRLDIRSRDFH
jgi:error-prone DNA polymerase